MNPRNTIIAILAALCSSLALADDFKTNNGKEYKNAIVTQVDTDGIVVKTKTGISKLYFTELPEDVQKRYHYDPANAAVAHAAQVAATQQTNQQIEESNKRSEVEKRKAFEVSRQVQSAEGGSRQVQSAEGGSGQNTANGPHIVGVGGVNGLTVEMSDRHLQLQAAAREEAQTPEEKADRYAANMKKYEGAKAAAARRRMNSNMIVPPRYGQLYYDPFANVDR